MGLLRLYSLICLLGLGAALLAGCDGAPSAPAATPAAASPTLRFTASPLPAPATSTSTPTPRLTFTSTPTITPSNTPRPTTPTPTLTPPPGLGSLHLRTAVTANTYITDTCEYLRLRWSPESSPPDTVVVPIMFHSIVREGRTATAYQDISAETFRNFVAYANYLGYETITTAQLVDFMYYNAPIPPRSMILILDDRRPGVVQDHFLPVLQANQWTLTLGWISDPDDLRWAWQAIKDTAASTGLLDVQAHGYYHNANTYITAQTTEDIIRQELFGPIPVIEEQFGARPLAFVWPGGNFTPQSVEIAREAGYSLGFTAYSRGPLLFNWVPLGPDEQTANDPLMVLPRFWSSAANVGLDMGVRIAAEARQHAIEAYAQESAWFQATCGEELPPLEAIYPPPTPTLTVTPTS